MEFRVVAVNPELVRGLWSGQQHELAFLRNQVCVCTLIFVHVYTELVRRLGSVQQRELAIV